MIKAQLLSGCLWVGRDSFEELAGGGKGLEDDRIEHLCSTILAHRVSDFKRTCKNIDM